MPAPTPSVGHHPHSLQPVDFHNGKPIFYCIGNFHHALGADDFPSHSAIFEISFDTRGGPSAVRVHPLLLDKGSHPLSLKIDDPRSAETVAVLRSEGAAVEAERRRPGLRGFARLGSRRPTMTMLARYGIRSGSPRSLPHEANLTWSPNGIGWSRWHCRLSGVPVLAARYRRRPRTR